MTHHLKLKALYYPFLRDGLKTCEVRFNDRNFKLNDFLVLHALNENPLTFIITHVLLGGQYGIHLDYVVLSLKLIDSEFPV